MPVQGANNTSKKRQILVTIREKVRDKYPDFDEQKHDVFLNGEQVDKGNLDRAASPFDIVNIKQS